LTSFDRIEWFEVDVSFPFPDFVPSQHVSSSIFLAGVCCRLLEKFLYAESVLEGKGAARASRRS
jgi:hypothetical protein